MDSSDFGYSDEGLVAEFDAGGNEIRSYGYEPGSEFGQRPLWLKIGGVYYWYVCDHLGTPRRLVDSVGTTVWEARYATLGAATVLTSTVESNLRLPGQYFDVETGLHYNWHRYYDPLTGRYISRDPVREEFNHFAYAQNDPLSKFDVDGLRVKSSLPLGKTNLVSFALKNSSSWTAKFIRRGIFANADLNVLPDRNYLEQGSVERQNARLVLNWTYVITGTGGSICHASVPTQVAARATRGANARSSFSNSALTLGRPGGLKGASLVLGARSKVLVG